MTTTVAQAGGLLTVPAIAAVGAAAVSIPILIHLMSRFRRRPEPWGAMRFLLEAYKKQKKRLQVERLLLLAVRCLVVLLAGLALAGPVLSGCSRGGGLGQLLTGSGGGRVVYLVVDDSLSTQTREAGGTRLDRLRQEALSVIDEMEEGDRAVVLRAGRPVQWVVEEPTTDSVALKDAVNSIDARYGRSHVAAALLQVERSMDALNVRDGQAVVVLLSDFPRSAAYMEEVLPPELEGLGDRASLVASRSAQGTDNVQVMSVTPRRRMVVASSGGAASISVEARLRRFGGEPQPRAVGLRVSLRDRAGTEVASTTRTARWLAGQREALVNLDLPAPPAGDSTRGGRELVVVARLVAANEAAGVDALPADDRAAAVVRLRERLQVVLVDDGSAVNPEPGALQPWQWMRAALSPMEGGLGAGPFEVSALLPSAVNESSLGPADAAVVLRPDQVSVPGWEALRQFAERGGLVWVFAPAVEAEARWPETMLRVFDLPWAVSNELAVSEAGGGAPLDATLRAPDVLQYLAADWREKLGWVSVSRRLPMRVPDEDRWVALDAGAAGLPSADMPALMAGREVGSGTVLLTVTPPDNRYTNLVVRPLFAPLVHDTLRGVLGDAGRLSPVVSGDAPDLGRGWRNAGELSAVGALSGMGTGDETPATVRVRTDGDAAIVIEPLEQPGVYRASAGVAGGAERLLAVNPDASAGDTFPAPPRLEQWLDKLGAWSTLGDRRDAGGVLTAGEGARDLTWALLWVVLALVVLEMWLARVFSHATDRDRPTVVGRALGALSGGEGSASAGTTSDAAARGRAA